MSQHRRVICALAFFIYDFSVDDFSFLLQKSQKLKILCHLLSREILLDILCHKLPTLRLIQHYALSDFSVFLLGPSNRFVNLPLLLVHTLISLLICATLGAKIIGSLGVLKHSLAILVIYLDTIDLWVLSNDKEVNIPTILFTSKNFFTIDL